ncbi:MAG TPA: hypothetical protein DCS05_02485 [Nitrospiraceae bacterium]|nr:hypothetical protein [Nitrospiraceae bacterium]
MMADNDAIVRMVCPLMKAGCFMADIRECTVVNQWFYEHKGYASTPATYTFNQAMHNSAQKGGRKGSQARNVAFASRKA